MTTVCSCSLPDCLENGCINLRVKKTEVVGWQDYVVGPVPKIFCPDCKENETLAKTIGWNGLDDSDPQSHGDAVFWMGKEICRLRKEKENLITWLESQVEESKEVEKRLEEDEFPVSLLISTSSKTGVYAAVIKKIKEG